jgi:hypothetical protein
VAKQTGLSHAKATEVVNAIFDAENRRASSPSLSTRAAR